MDGWKTSFLLGRPIFRGYVSLRECTCKNLESYPFFVLWLKHLRSKVPILMMHGEVGSRCVRRSLSGDDWRGGILSKQKKIEY